MAADPWAVVKTEPAADDPWAVVKTEPAQATPSAPQRRQPFMLPSAAPQEAAADELPVPPVPLEQVPAVAEEQLPTPPVPPYSEQGTYTEPTPGQDLGWPQPPSNEPVQQPYNPSPGVRMVEGIRRGVTEGGALGMSEDTLLGSGAARQFGETVFDHPTGNAFLDPLLSGTNRALAQAPAMALDLLSRPVMGAIRGGAGLVGGLLGGNDKTSSDMAERDLNVIGDITALLGSTTPSMAGPKVSGAVTDKAFKNAGNTIKWLGGADPEDLAIVRSLVDKGVNVSPAFAPELPILRRYVDLARALGTDPTAKSATAYATTEATNILTRLGKTPDEARRIINDLKTSNRPTMEQSEAALQGAAEDIQSGIDTRTNAARVMENDARQNEIAGVTAEGKNATNLKLEGLDASRRTLEAERDAALAKVNKTIDDSWQQFDEMRDKATPGNLGKDVPDALQAIRRNMSGQFSEAYDAVLKPVADIKGDTTIANATIADFLKDMPESFQASQPQLIRAVTQMAEDGTATLPELQWLRTQLRGAAGDQTLSPNLKTGPFKLFQNVVDDMINNPDAPTAWRQAADDLRGVDKKYGEQMAIWKNRAGNAMVADMRDGVAPDPAAIVETLNEKNQTQQRRTLLNLLPPEIKERATTATLDKLVRDSVSTETYGSGVTGPAMVNPKTFHENVVQMHAEGVLQDYLGKKQADQVLGLARQLAQRNGDIPLNNTSPTDFVRALQHAREADALIEKTVKVDPAKVMAEEAAKVDERIKEINKRPSAVQEEANPLDFLRQSRGATAAAEHLLQPDNVKQLQTVIKTLGNDSMPVQLLREEAAQMLLKPFLEVDLKTKRINPEAAAAGFKKLSDTTQELLFPNLEPNALNTLAREMRLILGTSGNTMPAFAANTILGQSAFKMPTHGQSKLNPFNYGRIATQYGYGALAKIVTSPRFVRVLTGELTSNRDVFVAMKKAIDKTIDRSVDTMRMVGAPLAASNNLQQPAQEEGAGAYKDITNESLGIPAFREYASGGLVEASLPITPEPQQDMDAQGQAMANPDAAKDAVFVSRGSPYPQDIPDNAIVVKRPEGDLITTNMEKAQAFRNAAQLTDKDMAAILSYPEAKSDVSDPVVAQGVTPDGGVSVEMLASRGNEGSAADAIGQQDPRASVRIVTPDDAQARRGFAKGGQAVPSDLMAHFQAASDETGVPLNYLLGTAQQESGFNPQAVSPTGARGIMQVLPSTAARPGYGMEGMNPDDLFDPGKNIRFGARYLLARARANTGGNVDWNNPQHVAAALRSYNGPVGAGGDPNYVNAVMRNAGAPGVPSGGGGGGGMPSGSAPTPMEVADNTPPVQLDEDGMPVVPDAPDVGAGDPQQLLGVVQALVMSGNAKEAIALLVNYGIDTREAARIVWSINRSAQAPQQSAA